jgi:Cu-Zn family superoxide dismutase
MNRALAILIATLLGVSLAQMPATYEMPGEQVYPEGIVVADGSFYVGSTTDGTIFRGDVASGDVTVFAEGQQPTAIGMTIDASGSLWVAGGGSGNVYRYSTETGELTGTFTTPEADATFLNDAVATSDGYVYVTDSMRQTLFRVATDAEGGEMEGWLSFEDTPAAYTEGFNLNGIVVTPDGASLLVIKSNTGGLFRIDIADMSVHEVGVDTDLSNGDGLVLEGQTLYVVRNANQHVVPVQMTDSFDAGNAGEPIASETFRFPTTAAYYEGSLLVVNSQFGARQEGNPELPFTVSRVDVP